MSDDKQLRVSIGLDSAPPLTVRLTASQLDALRGNLANGGWTEVEAEDADVHLNLDKVVFLRVEKDDQKVGFGL
ncbi:hypothetical protein [Patulibacter americanus]|uniref:hypothetical protein n=1 Tax=Patulibacter americanus TaxID=588672 RepID=UPI0003B42A7D|nr:hypothetical protein [Patulibacter americanus]